VGFATTDVTQEKLRTRTATTGNLANVGLYADKSVRATLNRDSRSSLLKNSTANRVAPSAAKAVTEKQGIYRSGKPLRHPKAEPKASLSANC
jgi:hypothetical protein